jgi:hypothetical protein
LFFSAVHVALKTDVLVSTTVMRSLYYHIHECREIPNKTETETAVFRSSGAITYGVFEEKIQSPAVRDYFETWPGHNATTILSYPGFSWTFYLF